jgi:predicted component of type VI protein secretion system
MHSVASLINSIRYRLQNLMDDKRGTGAEEPAVRKWIRESLQPAAIEPDRMDRTLFR